ncbi:hypothetical protein OH77DRAFT_1239462 [Trametes cingulata]|nr:hypothetical protein OH77DRAFT_1239462 [Trametes cingulata]
MNPAHRSACCGRNLPVGPSSSTCGYAISLSTSTQTPRKRSWQVAGEQRYVIGGRGIGWFGEMEDEAAGVRAPGDSWLRGRCWPMATCCVFLAGTGRWTCEGRLWAVLSRVEWPGTGERRGQDDGGGGDARQIPGSTVRLCTTQSPRPRSPPRSRALDNHLHRRRTEANRSSHTPRRCSGLGRLTGLEERQPEDDGRDCWSWRTAAVCTEVQAQAQAEVRAEAGAWHSGLPCLGRRPSIPAERLTTRRGNAADASRSSEHVRIQPSTTPCSRHCRIWV